MLIPSLAGGGAERVALFCAGSLSQQGYDVDLVVARNAGPLVDDPVARRLRVDLGARNEMLCLPRLVRYVRRAKPDLVIAMVHSAKIMAGLAKSVVPELPLVISVHNNLEPPKADRFWVRRFFGLRLERYLYRNVLAAHAVSEALAGQAGRFFRIPGDRVYAIHNPLVAPAAEPHMPDAHRAWFDRPVLMTAGRLARQKDHASLLKAFAASELAGSARLLILGDGPLRGRLETMAKDLGIAGDVLMPGRVADIRPYLNAARGFALSSRFEGFPLVLIEALRAGLPIAAFDCPTGPSEALLNGTLGRLLSPGDIPGLTRALRDMVSGDLPAPDPARAAGQLARFSPAVIARDYATLVEDCLARRMSPPARA